MENFEGLLFASKRIFEKKKQSKNKKLIQR